MSLREMKKIVRNLELFKNKNDFNKITSFEAEVIRYIAKKNGITNKELSNYLYVDKALTSRTVKNLEKRGYVYFKEHLSDSRSKYIFSTKKGNDYKNIMVNIEEKYFFQITKSLTNKELIEFEKLLEKIYTNSKNIRKAE